MRLPIPANRVSAGSAHPAPLFRGGLRRLSICLAAGLASGCVFLGTAPLLVRGDEPAPIDTTAPPAFTSEQLEFFEKRVRPLLSEHCYECHGPTKQKGGLRVDSRATLLAGGESGPAIVPGQSDEGYLLGAVSYGDIFQMPPTGKLSDEKIAALHEWILQGAPWPAEPPPEPAVTDLPQVAAPRPPLWSFQPLQTAWEVPEVNEPVVPLSPVDCFLMARLEQEGLTPAPLADRATLLRRITVDLTGLPPTPQELADFLADASPTAYGDVVERLLASPRYGERWGRHWLDLMRYAETCGHEFDFDLPTAWQYRDYVIRAFNLDLPYNQFLIEHLAGDLLPEPRRNPADGLNESILATAFLYLGEAKHSPVDIREDECARLDNQIDVFSKTFLGLGVSCARCHDHKFDPISQRDYYALAGFLRSSRPQQAFVDDPRPAIQAAQALAAWQQANLPEMLSQALAPWQSQLSAQCAAGDDACLAGWQPWLTEAARTQVEHPLYALALLAAADGQGSEDFPARRRALHQQLKSQTEAPLPGVVFEDFERSTYAPWQATGLAFGDGPTAATDMRVNDTHWSLAVEQPIQAPLPLGVAHSGRVADALEGVLRSPTFVIEHPKIWYRVAGVGARINLVIDGFQLIQEPIYGGLKFEIGHGAEPIWHEQNVAMWVGHQAYIEVVDHGPGYARLDCVRFGDGSAPSRQPHAVLVELLADESLTTSGGLARAYSERLTRVLADWQAQRPAASSGSSAAPADLLAAFLRLPPPTSSGGVESVAAAEAAARTRWLADCLQQRQALIAAIPLSRKVLAVADGTGRDEPVLVRGSHKTPGEVVPRRFLEALAGPEPLVPQPTVAEPASGSGRLTLAKQLTDPRVNPLVPRVIVNRLWHHHFGRGLVATPDDFGRMGAPPSHPELLDWLAAELIAHDWSLKHVHRVLVLSRAYQQSSDVSPRAAAQDPTNRYLSHANVRRLEAEAIRDTLLAVSGDLDSTPFGPGVPPYLTPFMVGRGRPAQSGPLDGGGRRSIYLQVRRNFLTPLFLAFDYPIPFTTIGQRGVSNVPAQALVMMNNPFVVGEARRWAERLLAEPGSIAERVERAYLAAFSRPPSEEEQRFAAQFLEAQQARHAGQELPAWSDLCHVLVNVKEFIFIP